MKHTVQTRMTKAEQVVAALRATGIQRTRDLEALGVSREYLCHLVDTGVIVREARGMYTIPEYGISRHTSLCEAAVAVPHGVICLLSALSFHQFTTQLPADVWMMLNRNAWQPRRQDIPMRFIRASGDAFSAGIEEHVVDSITVRVYHPAKTIADCFKYRNTVGLDVALEALREGWRARKATMEEIWHYAAICRVAKVMRPYMEMLVVS